MSEITVEAFVVGPNLFSELDGNTYTHEGRKSYKIIEQLSDFICSHNKSFPFTIACFHFAFFDYAESTWPEAMDRLDFLNGRRTRKQKFVVFLGLGESKVIIQR